jgi:ferric-dicitrate binding protein FerR (iron transport regulator)
MYKLLFIAIVGALFLTSCDTTTVQTEDNFEVVELPEGSVIYMNKNTEIAYSKDFVNNRNVRLKGEAYFDVVQNQSPFTIKTSQGSILITGTKLNVKSNEENEELDVEVDEGAIEVTANKVKKVVKRGERVVYNAVNDNMKMEKAQRKFEIWLSQLDHDLERLGKNVEKGLKKGETTMKKGVEKTEKKLNEVIK